MTTNPIAIVQILAALVIIAVSLPLVRGKVRRNQWYGIRIPEAFRSEERWLEINQYGGRMMVRWGFVLAVTAAIGLALPRKYWIIYAISGLAVCLGGLALVISFILCYAARTRKA